MNSKNLTYEKLLKVVDNLVDGAFQPVDLEIRPVIAALMMHGYKTTASCAGHPEKVRRCYPFVVLNYPEPEDVWEEGIREEWYQQNIKQQKRLAENIEAFYQKNTPLSFKSRLVINSFGAGVAELRSFGAEFIELEKDIVQTHATYLNEMQAFSAFLKNKR